MGTIKFTAYLTIKSQNNKHIEAHEVEVKAAACRRVLCGTLELMGLNEEGDVVSDPDTTLALEEAYQYVGFSTEIDRLIWEDIKESKIADVMIECDNYPAVQGWR